LPLQQPESKQLRQAVENIIQTTVTGSATSGTLANGDSWFFTITFTNTAGAKTLVVPDVTLYLTSVSSANQFPDGSNITITDWTIIGPWNDWGDTNNTNTVTRIGITNISAGNQVVLLRTQGRVIANTLTGGGSA
jgi:hypothetical protein